MDREEVLEKSRKENKGQDECERAAFLRGGSLASAVGALVCVILGWVEFAFTDFMNYGLWTVFFSMTGARCLVEYSKLRKKQDLIFAALCILFAVISVTIHVVNLIG